MTRRSGAFMFGNQTRRESVGEGLTRQLFSFDDSILMARVEFESGVLLDVFSHIRDDFLNEDES